MSKHITWDSVPDPELAGTAADYFTGTRPGVDKLYAYKLAGRCYGEKHCFEVPYGCCDASNAAECVGQQGCAGIKANEPGTIVWRSYLDPAAKTGPDPAEVIFDRAIKFSREP